MFKATLAKALTVAALVAAPLAIAPATAFAAPTTGTFQIPLVYNSRIWMCGFLDLCVFSPTVTTGEVPGTVTFPAMETHNGTYPIDWKNLGTGAAGRVNIPFDQTTNLFTGAGPVILTTTSESQLIAGTGIFLVP